LKPSTAAMRLLCKWSDTKWSTRSKPPSASPSPLATTASGDEPEPLLAALSRSALRWALTRAAAASCHGHTKKNRAVSEREEVADVCWHSYYLH
jgi:hypothetical protein